MSFNKKQLDKNTASLFLMLSGAGTGKSRNATEFHGTLIEFSKSQGLKDRLKKAMVFLITLENGKTPINTEFSKGVESIIGARMLAQVLGCHLSHVLRYSDLPAPDELCRQLAKNENMAFEDFTAVIVVDGLGSLLSSPEDMKNKTSLFYSALTVCANLTLQGAFIIPLCTATITGSPRKCLADTNRCRVYLELPPLDLPVLKKNHLPAFPEGLVADLFVGDCGGHGRALEALYLMYQTHQTENLTNYDDLVSLVIGYLKTRYRGAFERTSEEYIAILKTILSRTRLTRTSKIAGTSLTVELVEGNGLIRFEPGAEDQDEGYLSTPFIWIKTFASIYDGQKNNYPISRFLANFLRYHEQISISRGDPVNTQSWELFENFAAGFRVLKSLSLDEGQRVWLSQIHYGAAMSGVDLEVINHQMEQVQSTQQIRTGSSSGQAPKKIACITMRFGEPKTEIIEADLPSLKYCTVNGTNARGGDIFNLLKVVNSDQHVMEAGQCKKVLRVNVPSLLDEVKKATPKDGVFVLYTTADLTHEVDTSNYCTSFFVKKDNYSKYFGPFAGRAFLKSR